jgi:hypothetical protein
MPHAASSAISDAGTCGVASGSIGGNPFNGGSDKYRRCSPLPSRNTRNHASPSLSANFASERPRAARAEAAAPLLASGGLPVRTPHGTTTPTRWCKSSPGPSTCGPTASRPSSPAPATRIPSAEPPGRWGPGRETSAASPLFAGIVAIAGQYAPARLGLINPALYRLEQQHAPGIVDGTQGNNTVSFTLNGAPVTVEGYPAKPGYDLVMGRAPSTQPASFPNRRPGPRLTP